MILRFSNKFMLFCNTLEIANKKFYEILWFYAYWQTFLILFEKTSLDNFLVIITAEYLK